MSRNPSIEVVLLYCESIRQLTLSLHLDAAPVGVRFLFLPEEVEACTAAPVHHPKSCCALISDGAKRGMRQKADADNVSCPGALTALGLRRPGNFVTSGKQFSLMRLYASGAVARQATESLCFIPHRIAGLEVGPLAEMEEADVAVLLCQPWQAMRLLQGYCYYYGAPSHLGGIGNQGVCADLVARPYCCNDFNYSMLCPGARIHMASPESEMGCAMPIQQFPQVAQGTIRTTSLTMTDPQKRELLERMEDSGLSLDCPIELGKMYGSYMKNSPYPHERYDALERET